MQKNQISCAILAGGKAIRMNGTPKWSLPIGNEMILDRMLKVLNPYFDEILFVVAEGFSESLPFQLKIVHDVFPSKGPLGGIFTALQYSENDPVFVFSCDMPYINRELIELEWNAFCQQKPDVLIPLKDGFIEPLHAIYSCKLAPVIENQLKSCEDLRIRSFFDKVNTFYWDTSTFPELQKSFTNINSPEDLKTKRFED